MTYRATNKMCIYFAKLLKDMVELNFAKCFILRHTVNTLVVLLLLLLCTEIPILMLCFLFAMKTASFSFFHGNVEALEGLWLRLENDHSLGS